MAEPRRTQAERKAESDAAIIGAAIELFAEQGYVRTTLNEIGNRAGYTGGLVSKRFGSKGDLLGAVLEDIFDSFRAETEEGLRDTSSVLEGLVAYADVFLHRAAHPKSKVRALYVLLGESMGAVAEVQERFAEYNRHTVAVLASYVRQGVERGELRSGIDPVRVATTLIGSLRGLTIQYIIDPQTTDIEALRTEVHGLVSAMAAPEFLES